MTSQARANEVVIVRAGLATAVGLSLPEVAASVRAATMRFTESAIHDKRFEPFTLATLPEAALPPLVPEMEQVVGLTSRMLRMLRLAQAPLLEATAGYPPHIPLPGLALSVPETETTIPFDASLFVSNLWLQGQKVFDAKYVDVSAKGRAGGLSALGLAMQVVQSGRAPFMLAGGVDTYRDLYVLGTLDQEGRVKSSSNLDGFIPGEGAAFLLLATRGTAEKYGMAPLAVVSGVKEGTESGHLYSETPYRGDGLSGTLRQVWDAGWLPSPLTEVWSAMNGESHWGKEWGVAFLRNRPMFDEGHGMQHPADCYGDLGAASGPALVALAAVGMGGGYRGSPALVYASSDRGGRAAAVVRQPGEGG